MCYIKIKTASRFLTFINIDAPTEEKEEYAKDIFYKEVEQMAENIPHSDFEIIIGDTNAKIGSEEVEDEETADEQKQAGEEDTHR